MVIRLVWRQIAFHWELLCYSIFFYYNLKIINRLALHRYLFIITKGRMCDHICPTTTPWCGNPPGGANSLQVFSSFFNPWFWHITANIVQMCMWSEAICVVERETGCWSNVQPRLPYPRSMMRRCAGRNWSTSPIRTHRFDQKRRWFRCLLRYVTQHNVNTHLLMIFGLAEEYTLFNNCSGKYHPSQYTFA